MGSQVAIPLWATAMWLRCPGKELHRRRDLVIGRFWGGMQLGLSENDMEIMVSKGNHPQMALRFRLVNDYNLPSDMSQNVRPGGPQMLVYF